MTCPSNRGADDNDTLPADLLAALHSTFGEHAGCRATHAKGLVVAGTFTASSGARRLSRAAHFRGSAIPVTMRFSTFSGVPTVTDAEATSTPLGLGVRFRAAPDQTTDLVAHTFDGFPVGAPRDFLRFLEAVAASVNESRPNPAPLEAFLESNVSARRYLEADKPLPRSFGSTRYFGVNAFRLVAADGTVTTGRYRIDSLTPPDYVSDAERPLLPADYLTNELTERLRRAPLSMQLVFQIARAGDNTADGSIAWPHAGPDAREEVVLGELRIERVVHEAAVAARALDLDPGRLIDGLMLSDDPMVPVRSRVYRLGASRR
ncbi:catalase [Burkholderia arboris]|uniref:Catalase-related peroxidase n=1 Tax=Burkholderia arboris TaxID=488730 RepID=A0ABZ3DSB6_9BURK